MIQWCHDDPLVAQRMTYMVNLTRELLKASGVEGWTVGFDKATARLGNCRYDIKRITYGTPFLAFVSLETCRNTVLHEMDHVLAGPMEDHGPLWREAHLSLGGNGEPKANLPRKALEQVYDWVGECSVCGALWVLPPEEKLTDHGDCSCGSEVQWFFKGSRRHNHG